MFVQFVPGSNIGSKDRRLIRSHVMKGKNAGRPRTNRKPLIHRSAQPSHSSSKTSTITKHEEHALVQAGQQVLIERLLWNDLTIATFPEHVSPDVTKFVYHRMWIIASALFPPEFCLHVNLSQYAWFTYVLEDKAYFHCLLAISSSFTNNSLCGPRISSAASLKHISEAYRLVNQRLSSRDACSDRAIAVVTILAIYQRMHQNQSLGLIHFAGLRRMIQLRGGLAKFARENRVVAQKPWRIALEFSLQDGSPVAFGLDDVPDISPQGQYPNVRLLSASSISTNTISKVDPTLQTQFTSISSFTSHLNNSHAKHNPHNYSDAVCIRLHRLLDYAPLDPAKRHMLKPLDNLFHLSLVAVMSTLMPEYGRNTARYLLLANELQGALRTYAQVAQRNDEIILWALFIGYITVLPGSDHVWVLPLAIETCAELGLRSWEDVRGVLSRYAWIGILYDKAGTKLWNAIEDAQRKDNE